MRRHADAARARCTQARPPPALTPLRPAPRVHMQPEFRDAYRDACVGLHLDVVLGSDPSFAAAVAAVVAECLGTSPAASAAVVAVWLRGLRAAGGAAGAPPGASATLLKMGTRLHHAVARAKAKTNAAGAGTATAALASTGGGAGVPAAAVAAN